MAADKPFGPEPITTPSYSTEGIAHLVAKAGTNRNAIVAAAPRRSQRASHSANGAS